MVTPGVRLLVLGEWANVDPPTVQERAAYRRCVDATLSPDTVGLTLRRAAEIAAWFAQIERRLTPSDRRYLRYLGVPAWED